MTTPFEAVGTYIAHIWEYPQDMDIIILVVYHRYQDTCLKNSENVCKILKLNFSSLPPDKTEHSM